MPSTPGFPLRTQPNLSFLPVAVRQELAPDVFCTCSLGLQSVVNDGDGGTLGPCNLYITQRPASTLRYRNVEGAKGGGGEGRTLGVRSNTTTCKHIWFEGAKGGGGEERTPVLRPTQ